MNEELLAFAYSQEQEQTMDYSQCFNCGGSDFIETNYQRICEECQVIDPRYAVFTTENLQGYSCYKGQDYTCMGNFKKSIQCYQGLQKCHIPDSIYDALKDTEITRAGILKCLKELKYGKHYKNAHYIYYDLTGKLIDDIGYLEHHLIKDYREFIVAYRELQLDRKNSPNVQYVLYQLLRRRGHPCDAENSSYPRQGGVKLFMNRYVVKFLKAWAGNLLNL